jgi:heme-degrading monooxygenase HmoA
VHARVTTIKMDPGKIDDSVSQLESDDIPTFKQIDGFKGFTLLVDRESGKCIATSYWESSDTMKASEEQVRGSRERAAQTGGATDSPQVEHFEVAVDTEA